MAQRPQTQAQQRMATGAQRAGGGAGVATAATEGRPMTRGGLGIKKGATGGKDRVVQDKSFFMGVLRTKNQELNREIRRMTADSKKMGKDQETFVIYDTRAKERASELRGIQGEMADYNTLVEIMNMDSSQKAVDQQAATMRGKNDEAKQAMDKVYLERKQKEELADEAQREILVEEEKIDKLIAQMSGNMKKQFQVLKKRMANANNTIEDISKEMDDMDLKIRGHMEVINTSTMKKEAYALYVKLEELETKKEELTDEVNKMETPEEEGERLLREVKENNDAIAAMERQVAAMLEEMSRVNDAIDDLEGSSSGGSEAGDPLAAQKNTIDPEEIMNSLGAEKTEEEGRVLQLEVEIVKVLQAVSANLNKDADMMADSGLADNPDWQHIVEIERQMYSEMDSLKSSIKHMQEEAVRFADLEGFKKECGARQADLHNEHVVVAKSLKTAKAEYDTADNSNRKMQKELHHDETYAELEKLERKLASLEGNNFQMRETAAHRRATGEYEPIRDQTIKVVRDLNSRLVKSMRS